MDPRAWVSSPSERHEVETALRGLVGHGLVGVRYVELVYDGEPMWDAATFHSIDHGIEFELDDGQTWSVVWKQFGGNEGLLIYSGTVAAVLRPDAEVASWDVTGLWRDRFPRGFSDLRCVWTRHTWGPGYTGLHWEIRVHDGGESDLCLLSMILAGEGDERAVITLGGRANPDEDRFGYAADNVAVFFSVEDAQRAKVMLPGDPDAVP